MIDPLSSFSATKGAATADRTSIAGARSAGLAAEVGGNKYFSTLIADAIEGLSGQLRKSEAVSLAGLQGAASTQNVVEQLMVAEHSLQSAIAVRDKIVAAYLEIGRMAI